MPSHTVRGLTVVNIPSIRRVSSERVSESDKIVDRRAIAFCMGAIDTSILWTDKRRNLAKSSRIRNALSLSFFLYFTCFLVSFRLFDRTNPTIAIQSSTALTSPIRGTYFCNFAYFCVFKLHKFSFHNDRVIHHPQIIILHEHPVDMHNIIV